MELPFPFSLFSFFFPFYFVLLIYIFLFHKIYQSGCESEPCDMCMWEGVSVWEHARRWGKETRPDPAAAGSGCFIPAFVIQFL